MIQVNIEAIRIGFIGLCRLLTDYAGSDIMLLDGLSTASYHRVVQFCYPLMKGLQEQGKIRFIGFSQFFAKDVRSEGVVLSAFLSV